MNTGGTAGDAIEWDLEMREFVRLQIGSKWYRISPFFPWKHVGKMKKNPNNEWIDDGSKLELNGPVWQ